MNFVLESLKLKIRKSTEIIIDYQYCDTTRHQQPLKSGIIFTPLIVIINTVYLACVPVWWPGLKNRPTVTHACRKRGVKWVPSAWGYIWDTLSPGVISTWSSRLGVGRWTLRINSDYFLKQR
jgi:hypothetical protein